MLETLAIEENADECISSPSIMLHNKEKLSAVCCDPVNSSGNPVSTLLKRKRKKNNIYIVRKPNYL